MAVMWKKNPTTEFLELFRCPKNICLKNVPEHGINTMALDIFKIGRLRLNGRSCHIQK